MDNEESFGINDSNIEAENEQKEAEGDGSELKPLLELKKEVINEL